jgi:hypothetical protein
MRRAARIDNNQTLIIDALKKVGVSVEILGKPLDLLVCCRGETSLMEIKNPDRSEEWSKDQLEFIARWPGKIHIVRSIKDAIAAVLGAEAMR